MVKDWRLLILIVYLAAVGFIIIDASQPDQVRWSLHSFRFYLFAVSPIALLCVTRRHAALQGIIATLLAAFGLWAYIYTIYFAPHDGQSALTFIVVPIVQWVVAVATWIITRIVDEEEGERADAVSALQNLGFKPAVAAQAVARAQEELGEDAGEGDLIRAALKKAVG